MDTTLVVFAQWVWLFLFLVLGFAASLRLSRAAGEYFAKRPQLLLILGYLVFGVGAGLILYQHGFRFSVRLILAIIGLGLAQKGILLLLLPAKIMEFGSLFGIGLKQGRYLGGGFLALGLILMLMNLR